MNNSRRKRILVMAGGTGGHIFPALAVAGLLQEQGVEVQWLGSRAGMEATLLGHRFPLALISIEGVRGRGVKTKLLLPIRLLRAVWQAWCVVKRFDPDLVLGMGGFASAPGGIAAHLLRKPLIVHEQNAIAGIANRLLARRAKIVFQGFSRAFPSGVPAETIGNPLRPEMTTLAPPTERLQHREGPLRLLVLGGSQGAQFINQAVLQLLLADSDFDRSLVTVWHQTGQRHFDAVKQAYGNIDLSVTTEAFIHNMVDAYVWADLIICRAGALTVSEIAAVGVASILIPFPFAVDDHQYYNARYLADAGAAWLIRQHDHLAETLGPMIQQLATDRARLIDMAKKARLLAKPQALSAVAAACQRLP